MTTSDSLTLAGFAVAGLAFFPAMIIQLNLKDHVSEAKVHAVEDLSKLWKYERPPKTVLNERGLRLRRYVSMFIIFFLAAVITNTVAAVFEWSTGRFFLSGMIAGSFFAMLIVESRLKHHVSRDKVLAIEDVSSLWRAMQPPRMVLDQKGRRLDGYRRLSAFLFFAGMVIAVVAANFGYDLSNPEDIGLGSNP